MSSTRMQRRPSTSPMMFMTSETPARSRRLSMIARSASTRRAIWRARNTPPTSGDTMTRSAPAWFSLMSFTSTGSAYRLSVGMSKNPWICPAWRSRVSTRSAPAVVIRFATSFAEIVVRRVGGRLDDEDILAADVLVDLDKHLHIGKPPHARLGERLSEIGGDRLGEGAIAIAGQDFHRPAGKSAALGPDPAASRKCRCNKPARPKQSEPAEDSLPAANWMTLVRPSRRPLCGLLRMRFFLNSIISLPHPEERSEGASRRTHDAHAAPN